jgi:hypothetical protein
LVASKKFSATVLFDGPNSIPLQHYANRHRVHGGYDVEETFIPSHFDQGYYPAKYVPDMLRIAITPHATSAAA